MSDAKTYNAAELKRKYAEERNKRLRKEHEGQYVDTSGAYAQFDKDPYVEEPLKRDAVQRDVEVAIIGGGFGGLLTATELLAQGIEDFVIIERAADFGGTWYWNRYPGIRCDIEAYVYMPLLEEVGTIPSEKYATGDEIFAHAQAIGRHYDLYDRTYFQTKVEEVRWSEDHKRWMIKSDRGDEIRARYVTVSQGPLSKVKLPNIPGMDQFQGKMFHSARWDYSYTGGDLHGGLDKLSDKRIAVIGTGATAVQIVPKLAASAKEVLLFQRTPSTIGARNNRPTDMDWFKSQEKGWLRKRRDNFLSNITPGAHPTSDEIQDGWTDFFKRVGARIGAAKKAGGPVDPNEIFQQVDFEKMEEMRARIPKIVKNPAYVDSLTPWYNYLCKRPLFSDHFLESLNEETLEIIDTKGEGVTHITKDSVCVGDEEYPVDCIIFATGFDVGAAAHKVGGYDLIGRDGRLIDDVWADGQRSVHGTQAHGFPNFHIVGGTVQGTTAFNYTHILHMQAEHAADIIKKCQDAGAVVTEVTKEAEDRWLEDMLTPHAIDLHQYFLECTPGFLNNEGNVEGDKPTFLGGTFGPGPIEYEKRIKVWRETRLFDDTAMEKET